MHITVKLLKTNDKQKILKEAAVSFKTLQGGEDITYREIRIKMTVAFCWKQCKQEDNGAMLLNNKKKKNC